MALASPDDDYDACLLNAVKNQNGELTLNQIRTRCQKIVTNTDIIRQKHRWSRNVYKMSVKQHLTHL